MCSWVCASERTAGSLELSCGLFLHTYAVPPLMEGGLNLRRLSPRGSDGGSARSCGGIIVFSKPRWILRTTDHIVGSSHPRGKVTMAPCLPYLTGVRIQFFTPKNGLSIKMGFYIRSF